MQCPSCQSDMEPTEVGEQEVLVCESCASLWLSQGQLNLVDFAELDLRGAEEAEEVDRGVKCPSCDIPLHWHKFPTALQVEAPECYSCGGFFLTKEMVEEIRDNSMNESQRETYLNNLAHSVPGYLEAETVMKMRGGSSGFAKSWLNFKAKFKRK